MAVTGSTITTPQDEQAIAKAQWDLFRFSCDNGHAAYVDDARRNYRYFKGNGGQWSDDDRDYMEAVQGRKALEINQILPAVETAVGEQIASRADLCFKPAKGQASADTAEVLTRLGMHILEQNHYHRAEKQIWKDGLIKRRGYLDVRMTYEGNLRGEIKVSTVDPLCVVPDLFATSYDPKEWGGLMITSWLTADEIEGMYGAKARKKVEQEHHWGDRKPLDQEFVEGRNRDDRRYGFGTTDSSGWFYQYEDDSHNLKRYRVIERQHYKMTLQWHYVDPKSGDTEAVPSDMDLTEAREFAQVNRLLLTRINARELFTTVTTRYSVLFDGPSPDKTPTLIPFFYLFDYGDTLGMVDNAISPQDMLNKSLSCELHYLTTVSNSGWMVEEGSLVNMTVRDLEKKGMKSGFVVEYKKNSGPPQKIQPNTVPTGMDRMGEKGEHYIKTTTGMSDAEQGMNSPEVSGIAIQAKQWQGKLQLADPLDNLEMTRRLLGRKLLELIQLNYTAERIYKVMDRDDYGNEQERNLIINQVDPAGNIINDVTLGEYEVVVSSQPTAATYQESQAIQILEMRKVGVNIPDDEVVLRSNLSKKEDLARKMSGAPDNGMADLQLRMLEAKLEEVAGKVDLLRAQRRKVVADTTNTNIQAMFGATNAAKNLVLSPGAAAPADQMMLSAGFEDRNAPPVIPQQVPSLPVQPVHPENTSPNFPPHADNGVTLGIEGGRP